MTKERSKDGEMGGGLRAEIWGTPILKVKENMN